MMWKSTGVKSTIKFNVKKEILIGETMDNLEMEKLHKKKLIAHALVGLYNVSMWGGIGIYTAVALKDISFLWEPLIIGGMICGFCFLLIEFIFNPHVDNTR
jgi:hypothetical protein